MDEPERWVTVAFTWNGLRALGVDEESLATFPEEFREGMAARADILGDTGANHPEHWVGGLAGDDLHAIAILFARTEEQRRRCTAEHDKLLAGSDGVRSCPCLDLNATPPFNYAHDHFGFRDRLSQPVMKGSGEEPTPGSGAPLKPGEFISVIRTKTGQPANLPQPEVLSRNGSYMAYRRLEEHVGLFRDYPARTRGNPGRTRTARREVHGSLAQRRPAGARARQGRSRVGRGPNAQQRFQLQGDGPATATRARWAPTPGG